MDDDPERRRCGTFCFRYDSEGTAESFELRRSTTQPDSLVSSELSHTSFSALLWLVPHETADKNAGAKSTRLTSPWAARLKSCPDTKHQCGGARKIRVFPKFGLSTLSQNVETPGHG